jgi:hypothetical protein
MRHEMTGLRKRQRKPTCSCARIQNTQAGPVANRAADFAPQQVRVDPLGRKVALALPLSLDVAVPMRAEPLMVRVYRRSSFGWFW